MACIVYGSALRSAWTYQLPPDLNLYRTQQEVAQRARRERGIISQTQSDLSESRPHLLLAVRKLDTDGSLMADLKKR